MKNYFKNENGQAMVMVALSLVVIMGFGAFGIDIGRVALAKSSLQNIADAAALAGAQDLPSASTSISTAVTYADTNGLLATQNGITKDGDTISVTAPYAGDQTKIEVVVTRKLDYTFAQVLGFKSTDVTARAVAQVNSAGGAAFGYAVFAGEGTASFSGSNNYTAGSIYGKNGVTLGNKSTVNGDVVSTSSGVISTGNNTIINGMTKPKNDPIAMPDFSALIKAQAIVVNSQSEFNTVVTGKTVNGPIYATCAITVNGRINGTGVVYSSGTISFTNDTILQTASDHILFYAATGDMTFNGGNGVNVGILYAPNGKITVNGAPNSTTYGRLIARNVELNGSGASIYSQSGDMNGLGTLTTTKLVQ